MMQTNQAIYFVLFMAGALLWIRFGPYPIVIVVVALIVLLLWRRYAHQRIWRGERYVVTVKHDFREQAWVDYRENGQTLSFRGLWANENNPQLWVEIDEPVYFPPDYNSPLPEERIEQVQARIARGLDQMKIRHAFARTKKRST